MWSAQTQQLAGERARCLSANWHVPPASRERGSLTDPDREEVKGAVGMAGGRGVKWRRGVLSITEMEKFEGGWALQERWGGAGNQKNMERNEALNPHAEPSG